MCIPDASCTVVTCSITGNYNYLLVRWFLCLRCIERTGPCLTPGASQHMRRLGWCSSMGTLCAGICRERDRHFPLSFAEQWVNSTGNFTHTNLVNVTGYFYVRADAAAR